jgi:hypothetical protein
MPSIERQEPRSELDEDPAYAIESGAREPCRGMPIEQRWPWVILNKAERSSGYM